MGDKTGSESNVIMFDQLKEEHSRRLAKRKEESVEKHSTRRLPKKRTALSDNDLKILSVRQLVGKRVGILFARWSSMGPIEEDERIIRINRVIGRASANHLFIIEYMTPNGIGLSARDVWIASHSIIVVYD